MALCAYYFKFKGCKSGLLCNKSMYFVAYLNRNLELSIVS